MKTTIYSVNGQLIYRTEKPAGKTSFPIDSRVGEGVDCAGEFRMSGKS
jgi:hypothetical protein